MHLSLGDMKDHINAIDPKDLGPLIRRDKSFLEEGDEVVLQVVHLLKGRPYL